MSWQAPSEDTDAEGTSYAAQGFPRAVRPVAVEGPEGPEKVMKMQYSGGVPALGRSILVSEDTELEPGVTYRLEYRLRYITWLPARIQAWLAERWAMLKDSGGVDVTYWMLDTSARRLVIEVQRSTIEPALAGWVVTISVVAGAITAVLLSTALVLDRVARIDPVTVEAITRSMDVRSIIVLAGLVAVGLWWMHRQ